MYHQKTSAFSHDNSYFACISSDEKLLIWETSKNVFIDCKFDSSTYNTCSSMHWIPPQNIHNSPKKAKLSKNCPIQDNLLALGTVKGDILIYNVTNKNLYLHLVSRHSDVVNDMCFYIKTNTFYTCSNDKYIGIWDISSGKQISKWKADDSSISSICVIDDKNLLSSSASILWWNIPKKSVIRKFNGPSAEIFKLIAVNTVSLNSCYFLSAGVSDKKIYAWSLSSSEAPVASFILPTAPEDIDISDVSSKDKPLILSAVTNDGFVHLFEHALNGNVSQPILPKVSIPLNLESSDVSFISTKLSCDVESCIIAYGSSASNVSFKHIKIKESLKKSKLETTISDKSEPSIKLPLVNDINKAEKNHSINGLKATPTPGSSSKVVPLKHVDSVVSGYRRKLRSSTMLTVQETQQNPKENNTKDSKSSVETFLEALEAHNDNIIEAILQNNDKEFISNVVSHLPKTSLHTVIGELNCRLQQKYSPTLSKWLKEILKFHIAYLVQSQEALETLTETKKYLDSINIYKTMQKMMALKGFLSLQMQNSSSDESSENEDPMEL